MATQKQPKQDRQSSPRTDDVAQDPKRATDADGHAPGNAEKDPDRWVTGDESMTGAQASYLETLSEEAGEAFDAGLTKAEASKRIDALREQTGRGIDH